MLRRILVTLSGIVVIAVGAAIGYVYWQSRPGPVEGIWTHKELHNCLCIGAHFYHFHNGEVIYYAENHPPAFYFGSYKSNGDGSYTIHNPTGEFVRVTPKRSSLIWDDPQLDRLYRFHRVKMSQKLLEIIQQQHISNRPTGDN